MNKDNTDNRTKLFFKADRYNRRLSKAFLAVAAVGIAITLPAEMSRIFNNVATSDILNTDIGRNYIGHGKNFGQAIYYTQLAQFGLAHLTAEKAFKEKNLDKAMMQDMSVKASEIVMAAGYAWEKYTQLAKDRPFDWNDMSMYALGCTVLIGMNKLAKSVTDSKHHKQEAIAEMADKPRVKPNYLKI